MKENNWKLLWSFVCQRLKKPWGSPSFIFYFFIIVFLVGTIGVIYELAIGINANCFDLKSIIINISNVSIALIAASSVEIILIDGDVGTENYNKKDIQTLGVSLLVLGFIMWIGSIYFIESSISISLGISTLSLLLGYMVWWISNADNARIVGTAPNLKQLVGDNYELMAKPTDLNM